MARQAEIFTDSEGDRWWDRNKAKFPIKDDLVILALKQYPMKFSEVYEIGCSNGWRLEQIRQRFGMSKYACFGSDVSRHAVRNGTGLYPNIALYQQDAAKPMFVTADLVIFGFCLYVCDREDLFKIVANADAVLRDGGHLVIYDFDPAKTHAVAYKHDKDILTYKMDYSALFTGNPTYKRVHSLTDSVDGTSAVILKKDIRGGWPVWGG